MKRLKSNKPSIPFPNHSFVLRLDEENATVLAETAKRRHVSMVEYVSSISVAHAEGELVEANQHEVALTAVDQLTFWREL